MESMRKPYKIGLAVSKFYPDLAQSLIQGARRTLDPLQSNGKISSPVFFIDTRFYGNPFGFALAVSAPRMFSCGRFRGGGSRRNFTL